MTKKTEKVSSSFRSTKDITGVLPVGNQILVERLTEGELLSSAAIISTSVEPSNQAYVLAIGPLVNKENGIKVGDRVLLQGSFVPVPKIDSNYRQYNLVLPDMIKGILVEE